ncbi:MAG: hypothetical protein H0W40_14930 [Methylibium sp.]|uniref:hypothetical protein n=1 Tax=Methylibium sp. TaxID=2067992 RepID=UPI0017DD4FD7|nr:hypothetical protein [Methylibium sp.]MBA3598651.1 hypothetical protein [Methylibium sp.]
MSRTLLDITKTLYDTDGYRHTLVRATPVQILTLVEGFYWLWDRRSGRCLIEGMASNRLSNARPPGDDLQAGRDPVAETRAFFLAQKAVRSAAASATAVLAHVSTAARSSGAVAQAVRTAPALRALPAVSGAAAPYSRRRSAPAVPGPSLMTATLMVACFALALLLPAGPRGEPLR